MAVTPDGSPYVESSDLVANYPAVSLAVANKIDTKANTASPALTGQASITHTVPSFNLVESDSSNATTQFFMNGGNCTIRVDSTGVIANSTLGFTIDATSRMVINSDGRITGSGQSLGAGTAYTPVISGTGWALGNGVITGAYSVIGKLVYVKIVVQFGSTSTFGGSPLQLSLPLTAVEESTVISRYTDTNVGANYTGKGLVAADLFTTMTLNAIQSAAGLIEPVINSKPFTWANTDVIRIDGWYRST